MHLKQEASRSDVGQDGILPRIGNPPGVGSGITYGPIANRPQVTNLPHNYSKPWSAVIIAVMKVLPPFNRLSLVM